MSTISERYLQKLNSIPAPGGGGCHQALLGVANLGLYAGRSLHELFDDIKLNIPNGGRQVDDREIVDAINKAQQDYNKKGYVPAAKKPLVKLDGQSALNVIIDENIDIAEPIELLKRSPYKLDPKSEINPTVLLETLYKPDDVLFIGDRYSKTVKTVAEWCVDKKLTTYPHVMPNALTGNLGKTKSDKDSYRCDACVKDYRFAVVEFDNIGMKQQIAFWITMIEKGLPIAVLIHSGKKSIHGWLAVNCKNVSEWESEVENKLFPEILKPLGVDSACKNESRLSRLPGYIRDNNFQKILYLNPDCGVSNNE